MKHLHAVLTTLLLASATTYGQATSYPASAGDNGGSGNSYYGDEAGFNILAVGGGQFNTFIGAQSGRQNQAGDANTFLGNQSGRNSTGGNNTFLGYQSGYDSGNASGNVFLGYQTGFNETGSNLLYIANSSTATPLIWGNFATAQLRLNGSLRIDFPYIPANNLLNDLLVIDGTGTVHRRTAGSLVAGLNAFPSFPESAGDGGGTTNAYFGHEAGLVNTAGNNTFIGQQSGYNTTTGYENSALGSLTLYANTSGVRNTAQGAYALYSNVTGNENTATGYAALGFNSTGAGNTANGYQALLNNNSNYNTAVGYQSGFSNTLGANNAAYGYQALRNNTTAGRNTAIGVNALYTQSYSNGGVAWDTENVAIGFEALYSNQPTGSGNGKWNTAIGATSLQSNTTGSNNTAIGEDALNSNTTGAYNTAVGNNTLLINTTGSLNTALGFYAGPSFPNGSFINSTAIGSNTTFSASYQIRLGDVTVSSIGGPVNWTNLSDGRFKKEVREDVTGLAFIEKLRPVSYELDRQKLHRFLRGADAEPLADVPAGERSAGFIAQEVERVVQENGYVFSGVDASQNEHDPYGLRYAEFVVPLVKGMQELSVRDKAQQERIDALQQLVAAQQQELETLKSIVYGNPKTATASSKTTGSAETEMPGGFALYQNAPNPFDKATVISALVPENIREATIAVYNLQGLELERYPLRARGSVSVTVSGGRLPPGMYLYALVADGRVIDTKKMILTN